MSKNQHHGNVFEHRVRRTFDEAPPSPSQYTARFDIEAAQDPEGWPTSIKTTGNATVCLADARRNFEVDERFRLVVGRYRQVARQKVVHEVHEFRIKPAEWVALKGGLPDAVVSDFHAKLTAFGPGQHAAARAWAKTRKAEIKQAYPKAKIQLNPKVDSQRQRRLQASIRLEDLCAGVVQKSIHDQAYRGLALPCAIESGPRERRSKTTESSATTESALVDGSPPQD